MDHATQNGVYTTTILSLFASRKLQCFKVYMYAMSRFATQNI